ncbi:histidine kinase [Catenulispora yoronensis]|uniref:histidine kinase n=1 Tax=Catenulispora yoronensis TaxID=450799 RepID=A0ABN2U2H4_9ACTN
MSTVTGGARTAQRFLRYFAFRSGTEAKIVVATVLALALFGCTDLPPEYGRSFDSRQLQVLQIAIVVVRPIPMLWFRRNPRAAFGGVLIGVLGSVLLITSPMSEPLTFSAQVSVLAVLAAAGHEAGRRRTVEMATVYAMVTLVLAVLNPDRMTALAAVVGECVLTIGCLELLRYLHATRKALVVQEERTETEQTHRMMLEERARIGRELHDVVAHHMSLIAVQAETAPYRIPGQSPETAAEFRSISAASREALNDMRKILGLLRSDSAKADTAPQPGLADVPALAEEAGARLETSGELMDVPPLAGVAAYRVVQESLSNARRHAHGAEVLVRVARVKGAVWLEVRNGPATAGADRSVAGTGSGDGGALEGGGHGIAGMRERVTLVHGEFEAGPTPDGGFAVVATLPLERGA